MLSEFEHFIQGLQLFPIEKARRSCEKKNRCRDITRPISDVQQNNHHKKYSKFTIILKLLFEAQANFLYFHSGYFVVDRKWASGDVTIPNFFLQLRRALSIGNSCSLIKEIFNVMLKR